ncbi:MAG TPA: glycosyltransferase [Bacteroidia bacterium]|nr:glycosyltransferase [Bacteroidia bacterium]
MKKVIVSVINDLVTDQRVHKTCTTLHDMGYDVLLVGRRKRDSLPLANRSYATFRMKLSAEKGIWFYFFFQWRLLFFLLQNKSDVYVSNDLDTLWPNYIVSKWRKKPLVYDAHEIFTEVPELVGRKFKQNLWKRLERKLFPKLKFVFTVNDSIADWYEKEYGIRPNVVRNIPRLKNPSSRQLTRKEVHLPENKKIILLQGAGINVHRGAEEAVEAMQFIDDAVLLIIGGGDVLSQLKEMAAKEHLEGKIIFVNKLPPDELNAWTKLADIGLTLDKDTNINYRFSLPNKIFDYIHAEIPVLSSDLVEVRRIVETYNVGKVTPDHEPETIAMCLREMLASPDYSKWKENTIKASSELNWEKEEEQIRKVYSQFL